MGGGYADWVTLRYCVFTIPGFGFLYGAGALVGIIVGLDLGIVAGGFISLLTFIGIKDDKVVKCHEHLKEGKFIVIANGSKEEIQKAKHILHTEGNHLEFVS